MVQRLVDALNMLNNVRCSGREDFARMLTAMQKIEEVAAEIKDQNNKKEM